MAWSFPIGTVRGTVIRVHVTFFLLLLWRLAKKHRSTETICLLSLTLYLFMENKPFLLSANPFLLLAPIVFFGGAAAEKKPDKT